MHDTIAAIATPPGQGGVGIVRVSGPEAGRIADAVFRPSRGGAWEPRPYVLRHGAVVDAAGREVDEVLAVWMPGPGSFTGEDVLELQGHGGVVLGEVLEVVLAAGARMALPGEFSKRAYLNGKLDLSQAEAVAELVAAPTRAAAHMARMRQVGALGAKVRGLREKLLGLRGELCVAVDFPDDEVECLSPERLGAVTAEVAAEVRGLLAAFTRGRVLREGAVAVLAGAVNAGKSSLLNALLGRERAIVTDIPGTTRDWIEEAVDLSGVPVRLVDTAGLRETGDAVELEGVRRSRELLERADVVLLVVDGTRGVGEEAGALVAEVGAARMLGVVNKADLGDCEPAARALEALGLPVLRVSARTGRGVGELAAALRERVLAGAGEAELSPNARQAGELGRALEELDGLGLDLAAGVPYDLLGVRLESACAHLAEVTGEITSAQVLDAVFSTFCIGK